MVKSCQIFKDKIEGILPYNYIDDLVVSSHNDFIGVYRFENILGIEINHHDIQKIDVDVYITKLLNKYYSINNFITYETNVDSISSLDSTIFRFEIGGDNSYCQLKKEEGKNLLFLCQARKYGNYSLGEITEDIPLDNINIKYNFILKPVKNEEEFIVKYYSGYFGVTYPLLLDFTKNDNLIVEYYGVNPDRSEGIRLNPDAEELECENEIEVKRCFVPLNHFERKASGHYYTYRNNYLDQPQINYESPRIEVILPIDYEYKIRIKEEDNKNAIEIGEKGTLYLFTDYNEDETNIFDPSDIEENTIFETTIIDDEENTYNVNCRLFKPTGEKLIILCHLNENLKYTTQNITLTDVRLTYHEYNLTILSETSVTVNQLNYPIPFIYSDKQIININDDTEEYELKFKYDSYNENDLIYIRGYLSNYNYAILDNCETKEKELICKMSKEKLETLLVNNKVSFKLGNLNDNYGTIMFDLVYYIDITYEIAEKEDIYVTITKLLNNVTESASNYAYETNITGIPELYSNTFLFEKNGSQPFCYFKKNKINNLLFICEADESGKFSLGKIEEEIVLDKIHYKYNFRIQPMENNETVEVDGYGAWIDLVHPEVMNFTEQEAITLRYIIPYGARVENIKLNPDSDSYLKCEDLVSVKKCTVPVSHFKGHKTGYYYTYQYNHLKEYSINYDANPIEVILPPYENIIEIKLESESNQRQINIGQKGTLDFITNYKDTENIFDPEDIEETTIFETVITDEEKNDYKVICRLWKPSNEYLRLFCDLNETLIKNQTLIDLKVSSFVYKNNKVIIVSYLTNYYVSQHKEVNIPFLYSDKQVINIEEEKDKYFAPFICKISSICALLNSKVNSFPVILGLSKIKMA